MMAAEREPHSSRAAASRTVCGKLPNPGRSGQVPAVSSAAASAARALPVTMTVAGPGLPAGGQRVGAQRIASSSAAWSVVHVAVYQPTSAEPSAATHAQAARVAEGVRTDAAQPKAPAWPAKPAN